MEIFPSKPGRTRLDEPAIAREAIEVAGLDYRFEQAKACRRQS